MGMSHFFRIFKYTLVHVLKTDLKCTLYPRDIGWEGFQHIHYSLFIFCILITVEPVFQFWLSQMHFGLVII